MQAGKDFLISLRLFISVCKKGAVIAAQAAVKITGDRAAFMIRALRPAGITAVVAHTPQILCTACVGWVSAWGGEQASRGGRGGTRRMGQEGCSSYPRRGAPEPHLITGEPHQPLLGYIGIGPPSPVSSILSVLQGGPRDRDTPAAGEFLESPMESLSFLRRESSAPTKPTGISESVPSARSWAQRLGSCGEWNVAPPSTVSWVSFSGKARGPRKWGGTLKVISSRPLPLGPKILRPGVSGEPLWPI